MSLRRELGLYDAVAIGLGAIIGAGIFVVTGVAASVAGPAFIVGLALAGAAATCNALSSAELAAVFPQAGGAYEYGYRLLRPAAGFAAGWMFLASKISAAGAVALGFGSYLSRLLPALPPRAAAIAAVILLAAVNLLGIRKAGRINTVIVAVTLVALLAFVAVGLPRFDATHLTPFAPSGLSGILESAALLFFAYTGYARVATLGEEVRDPARTIPRAITITIVAAVALYAAVSLVALGAIGAEGMGASASPLEAAAATLDGGTMRVVIGIGATTAMLGVLASQILAISRMMFAMARRGDLPGILERVSVRHGVPHIGIVLTAAIILVTILFGTLDWVVASAAFTILLYYGIANVAALRLERGQKRFHPAVALFGLVACTTLACALRPDAIVAGIGLLAVGLLLRYLLRRSDH